MIKVKVAGVVILIIFLVLIVLGIFVIGVFNKLTFHKMKIMDKFRAINDCLNERIEISKRVVNIFVEGNYNEEGLVMEINNLAREIEEELNVNNLLMLIDKSDDIFTKVFSLDKMYDNLGSNKEYKELADRFKNNQYKIMYAIEVYNEEVSNYNNYKIKKFVDIIFKIFKFVSYNYYKK